MKNLVADLNEKQRDIVERIWMIAINTSNTVDVMKFKNEFNDSAESIDKTIERCVYHIREDLRKIEEVLAVKV
jgi:RNA polymerase-binding transcription factor DksA